MEKAKIYSFLKRVVTSLVLLAVVLGCLYAGPLYVLLLALTVGAAFAWEWAQMVPSVRGAFFAVLYLLVTAAAVFTGPSWTYLAFLIVGSALALYKARGEARRNLLVLGVFYVSLGIGSITWLYLTVGPNGILWFMLAVWGMDIGGMIVGCSLKGPKLAPKISPNKTWSGLIGGILLAVCLGNLYCWYAGAGAHLLYYGLLAAAIAVVAQIGDLVESQIKRSLNLKDSSDLIPGHGGVFDRIDGLVFAAPLFYVLFRYFLILI